MKEEDKMTSIYQQMVDQGVAPNVEMAKHLHEETLRVAKGAAVAQVQQAAALEEARAASRWYDKYRVVDRIPEGESGNVRIVRKTITQKDAQMLNLGFALRREPRRAVPGDYLMLYIDGGLVMSDTPDEISDHHRFIEQAHGNVLIAGLGIGMVTLAVAAKPEVEQVVVIEENEHVIRLVAPHMPPKVRVIHADAFKWLPEAGMVFDRAWMDIWPDICEDNLKEMVALRRRYRSYMRSKSANVIGCWSRELIMAERDRARSRRWR